jgi:ADP-heptose:LPS heptosyltransferase
VDNYNKVYYSSFGKLIELIKASDYVISSDSLPVHLAFYLGVPHYILYPKKVNKNWLTPYAKVNKTYGIFEAHENLYPIINNIIG